MVGFGSSWSEPARAQLEEERVVVAFWGRWSLGGSFSKCPIQIGKLRNVWGLGHKGPQSTQDGFF